MIATSLGPSLLTSLRQKVFVAMDVILHLGAHRCATTSFQDYMRRNAKRLTLDGVGFWGPLRTRHGGVFSGVIPEIGLSSPEKQLERARGRVLTQMESARDKGIGHLIVSDENMLGILRRNIRGNALYGDAGIRLSQYFHAFDGHITRIALSIRSLEMFWASSLGYGVARGLSQPSNEKIDQIAQNPRTWRDVITDIACAMPHAEINVLPFEAYAGRPEAKLASMVGENMTVPQLNHRQWLNRTPNMAELGKILEDRGTPDSTMHGIQKWQPFNNAQISTLREKYQDDLHWLYAGADGLARLTEETRLPQTRINLAGGHSIKGQNNGIEQGRVA